MLFPTFLENLFFGRRGGGIGGNFDKNEENLISCFITFYDISNIFRVNFF